MGAYSGYSGVTRSLILSSTGFSTTAIGIGKSCTGFSNGYLFIEPETVGIMLLGHKVWDKNRLCLIYLIVIDWNVLDSF